jgi:predicted translin family RNA/ssDNA-binding protein
MLEFDFRNGYLRRKYDGLKYAVKTIEEILYELSLVHHKKLPSSATDLISNSDNGDGSMPMKRMRIDESASRIQNDELNAIKERMELYDKEREKIIKMSRDAQKLSKQSIFSIHRNDLVQAQEKADSARVIIVQMMEQIVKPHPSLRAGSFTNCVEEWAEGVLFLEWTRNQRILTKSELGSFVTNGEYIGALSDFTGEIGRMAVYFASQRNIDAVHQILQADLILSSYLSQFNTSGAYTKKLNAVIMNYKKVEDILYELTLQRMGGKALRRDPEPMAVAEDGSNANATSEES